MNRAKTEKDLVSAGVQVLMIQRDVWIKIEACAESVGMTAQEYAAVALMKSLDESREILDYAKDLAQD